MKKFFLLYFSLFSLLFITDYFQDNFAKYFLTGYIVFQFFISLGTFLLDNNDLKEIYQNGKKVPLFVSLLLDLFFIALLFYYNLQLCAFLWFAQSFLINNTFVKAELLYSTKRTSNN